MDLLSESLLADLVHLDGEVRKLLDMAQRDGFLHPATVDGLTPAYVRVLRSADRVWQVRQE